MKSDLSKSILSTNKSTQEKAILELYKYCNEKSRKFASNYLVDQDFIKDAIQDAIVITYSNVKSGKFQGLSSLETYALSICKNICLIEFKRNLKHSNKAPDNINEEINEIPQEQVNKTRLGLLLNQLSSSCSSILIKFYIEQQSLEELNNEYKLGSVQAMKNKKYRCMKKAIAITKRYNFTLDSFFESNIK